MSDRSARASNLRSALLAGAGIALTIAALVSPRGTIDAARQTWPPFALVAGLLMLGVVAHGDGLFAALAAGAGRLRAGPRVLLACLLGVVALVTAVLNLDTSVAFLTPVLVLAARARGLDEEPFLYGTLLMSNAASLLLPGSNLTNLLVLARDGVPGGVFAARMFPAWVASVVVTALFTATVYRRPLRAGSAAAPVGAPPGGRGIPWSAAGILLAVAVLLVLPSPAVPVLVIGAAAALIAVGLGAVAARAVLGAVDPASLAGVFAAAVALGAVARAWTGPAHLMATASRAETAVVGALGAVLLNNLPAAVLLASRPVLHPRALLLGLDLGPNLAVTGSLSALIWFRSAKAVGAQPSAAQLSRLGIVLVPLSLAAAGAALRLFA